MKAFDIRASQLRGPAWLYSQRVDLLAKVPPGTTISGLREMLRQVLAERFRLEFHREDVEFPIYALVCAPGGIKLRDPSRRLLFPPEGYPRIAEDSTSGLASLMTSDGQLLVAGFAESVEEIAGFLENFAHRPIIDETGLASRYDFALSFMPQFVRSAAVSQNPEGDLGASMGEPPPLSNFAQSVQKQLGLRLEPRNSKLPVVIVDRMAKTPTEN